MYSRRPVLRTGQLGGFGGGPPVASEVLGLLGLIFLTFTFQFFESTRGLLAFLRLGSAVWERGWLWQLLTYGFTGSGRPDLWFLLQLLILFFFARDVYAALGRRRFWRLLLAGVAVAGATAVLVELGMRAGGLFPERFPFVLIQGQQILLAILVAAFATLHGSAVIYLMFVLPVQARWFLPLTILFGFLGFLWSKDLAGFFGIVLAVGATWALLSPGGPRRWRHELWLRLQQRWLQLRLQRLKKRRGLRVVEGGKGRREPWVH